MARWRGDSKEISSDPENQSLTDPRNSSSLLRRDAGRRRIFAFCAAAALLMMVLRGLVREEMHGNDSLNVVSWNIAAINNNPFEYWITHEDADYNRLMYAVQGFIDAPGERDVAVSAVFGNSQWLELKELMRAEGWSGLARTEQRWQSDFQHRKIIRQVSRRSLLHLPHTIFAEVSPPPLPPPYNEQWFHEGRGAG